MNLFGRLAGKFFPFWAPVSFLGLGWDVSSNVLVGTFRPFSTPVGRSGWDGTSHCMFWLGATGSLERQVIFEIISLFHSFFLYHYLNYYLCYLLTKFSTNVALNPGALVLIRLRILTRVFIVHPFPSIASTGKMVFVELAEGSN